MVKSVFGEETRLNSAEDRLFQSAVPAQVGLVVGKLSPSSDRGFVYDLVPTPPTDAGLPACSLPRSGGGGDDKKKGSRSGGGGGRSQMDAAPAPLLIDADWVAEHARQVFRMLLGGMRVVGIYVWASESSFKVSSLPLWQTVEGVAQSAPFSETDWDERLLIHISYSPRRWTCRTCMLSQNNVSAALRPCDFKMGKLLSSLQTFRCVYKFEIRLPICHVGQSNTNTLRNLLQNGITNLAKELKKGAKALIDGNLLTEDLQCTSVGLHEIELLLPFPTDVPSESCRLEEVVGLVVFSGTICAYAYLSAKEPTLQAVSEIKGDIITSLQSRLDIIFEESEGIVDSLVNSSEAERDISVPNSKSQLTLHDLRKPCVISFPRRVLVPWLAGVFICDYLRPSETFEDLNDHCQEIMSMETPVDRKAILELEDEATSVMVKSFWDVVPGRSASPVDRLKKTGDRLAGKPAESGVSKGGNVNVLIAILVLLLSVVVGWGIISFGSVVKPTR